MGLVGRDPDVENVQSLVERLRAGGYERSLATPPSRHRKPVLLRADVVITMSCGGACPLCPGKRYMDWQLDAPSGGRPTRGV